jgi:hypothetical protein
VLGLVGKYAFYYYYKNHFPDENVLFVFGEIRDRRVYFERLMLVFGF